MAALPFAGCVVTMSYDDFGDQKQGGASDGGNDAHVCVPKTCQDKNANCGDVPDDCGGILSCGVCPSGETCGGGGENRCGAGPCEPDTCNSLGALCGTVSDGCGKTLECGTPCTSPKTCGGAGVPNQCGCESTITCAAANAQCGQINDGCGGTTDCGGCPNGMHCSDANSSGGVDQNTCVCDDPCLTFQYDCGYATDCNVSSVFCPCDSGAECIITGPGNIGTCS
jgi:hypothetical protein